MEKAHPIILSILIMLFIAACSPTTKDTNTVKASISEMTNNSGDEEQKTAVADTIPRVTGIGGVFFNSENPVAIKEWYAKNLGLQMNDWGSSFEFRNANRPDEINYLQWSPHDTSSSYFEPSNKEYMINYRVQNIEGLVRNLKANGVTIVDEIQKFEYGKFVHILDSEGTKVELWEPIDSVLTAIGAKTTK